LPPSAECTGFNPSIPAVEISPVPGGKDMVGIENLFFLMSGEWAHEATVRELVVEVLRSPFREWRETYVSIATALVGSVVLRAGQWLIVLAAHYTGLAGRSGLARFIGWLIPAVIKNDRLLRSSASCARRRNTGAARLNGASPQKP